MKPTRFDPCSGIRDAGVRLDGLLVEESAHALGRLLVDARLSPSVLRALLPASDRLRLLGGRPDAPISPFELAARLDALARLHPGDPEQVWMALGARVALRWMDANGHPDPGAGAMAETLGRLLVQGFALGPKACGCRVRRSADHERLSWSPGRGTPDAIFHATRGAASLALGRAGASLLAFCGADGRIDLRWRRSPDRGASH